MHKCHVDVPINVYYGVSSTKEHSVVVKSYAFWNYLLLD